MRDQKHLVVLSGMSGAGKATAAKALEDLGFFVVDNLPPQLLDDLIDLTFEKLGKQKKIAVIIDIREQEFLKIFPKKWQEISKKKYKKTFIFLDASDQKLIERFKETKRDHPLDHGFGINLAIKKEREILYQLKSLCSIEINTDKFNSHELKNEIKKIILKQKKIPITINLLSFGFRYGIPLELDFCFDVRFIKNPYYESGLKNLSGLDEEVKRFVLEQPEVDKFIKKIINFIRFLYPLFQKEGRSSLYIAIGCTGGKHRSVVFVEVLYEEIKKIFPLVKNQHRDKSRS